MINYIAEYMETLSCRRVTPIVEPGYLRKLLPKYAPKQGESFRDILKDVEKVIMPGVSQSELLGQIRGIRLRMYIEGLL